MQSPLVNFTLIEETEDLIVVNKPAGVLVHPTKPGGPVTLWDSVSELLAYEIANGGQVSIINRLDRETSGLTLIAKSAAAARQCSISMARRQIAKEYLAIVTGWPQPDTFSVDEPLVRAGAVAESPIWLKRGVHPEGAVALTHFTVLERWHHGAFGPLALIRAIPVTGRTHQIRVHLSHYGFPVVGDKIYGPDEQWYLYFVKHGWTPEIERALHLSRHALHSASLSIIYDERAFRWQCGMPADMQELMPDANSSGHY